MCSLVFDLGIYFLMNVLIASRDCYHSLSIFLSQVAICLFTGSREPSGLNIGSFWDLWSQSALLKTTLLQCYSALLQKLMKYFESNFNFTTPDWLFAIGTASHEGALNIVTIFCKYWIATQSFSSWCIVNQKNCICCSKKTTQMAFFFPLPSHSDLQPSYQ